MALKANLINKHSVQRDLWALTLDHAREFILSQILLSPLSIRILKKLETNA